MPEILVYARLFLGGFFGFFLAWWGFFVGGFFCLFVFQKWVRLFLLLEKLQISDTSFNNYCLAELL